MSLMVAILRGLLRKQTWEEYRSILSDDVFNNTDVRTIITYIRELHDKRPGDLTTADLRLHIDSLYRRPDGRKETLLELVNVVESVEDMAPEAVHDYISTFVARELAAKASVYIAARQDSDEFDVTVPYELMERAMDVSSNVGLDIDDMADAPAPCLANERPGIMSLGLGSEMDNILGGGVASGEMLIWLAKPGTGKTSYLINQAVQAVKHGRNVLHISLEINLAKCRQRVDQCLTGMRREERLDHPDMVMARRKDLVGKLYLKDWSHAHITVDDVKALVTRMRAKGQEIDALSLDYLELLSPIKYNRNAERFNYGQIAKDFRKMTNALHVVGNTAWQINRAGADKHVVGDTDVSECWDIIKHADIIAGLNQGPDERTVKTLRVNVIKQRESTERPLIYLHSDLDRMIIKPIEEGEPDADPEAVGSGD